MQPGKPQYPQPDIIPHSEIEQKERTPHCCPVCGGNGLVPNGFYFLTKGCSGMTSDASPEQCRSCNGTGVLWG